MADAAEGAISERAMEAVRRLIDHAEGGLAMLALADAIVADGGRLPQPAIDELRELIDGYGLSDELPAGLEAAASDGV